RYYRAAQANMSWFKADGLARQAIKTYNAGDLESAVKQLNDALSQPDLEPAAIQSGKNLRDRWLKIDEAWRKGYEAEQKNDFVTAKELFRFILDNEPVLQNVYRLRADKELAAMDAREQSELDGALKEGIELLDSGKCDRAYEKFCFVLDKAQNPGPPRNQIEEAVSRADKEKGLYKEANEIYKLNKKDRFPRAREILQLLGRFLPEKDAHRDPAIQLLTKVKG